MLKTDLFIFLTAMVIAFVLTPVAIKIAPKIGAMDIPKDNRRAHTKPMPRFGGMAIFFGATIALLIFMHNEPKIWALLIAGTLMYIMGVIDDLKNLPAKLKFVYQMGCAVVLYIGGINISFVRNPFHEGYIYFPWFISLIITVIWVVGITNTVNLIDGLDGLAAGVSLIASVCIAYCAFISKQYTVAACMLAIAGSAAGFLPFNFHPAKIFMGDGGSLFLGFMMAGISVMGSAKGATLVATIVPFLVLFLPIFDTAFAIVRRAASGRPIMEADKGHLHHRIMSTGIGQARSVLILYGISATMGVVAILAVKRCFFEAVILLLVAFTFIYLIIDEYHVQAVKQAEANKNQKAESEEAGSDGINAASAVNLPDSARENAADAANAAGQSADGKAAAGPDAAEQSAEKSPETQKNK